MGLPRGATGPAFSPKGWRPAAAAGRLQGGGGAPRPAAGESGSVTRESDVCWPFRRRRTSFSPFSFTFASTFVLLCLNPPLEFNSHWILSWANSCGLSLAFEKGRRGEKRSRGRAASSTCPESGLPRSHTSGQALRPTSQTWVFQGPIAGPPTRCWVL